MVLSTGWSPTEKRNQHHRRHLLLRNWDRVSFSWWLRRWCLRRRWANNVLMYCAPLADAVVDGVVVSLSCWPRRWCSWWLWYPWRCWWLMTMIDGGEWLSPWKYLGCLLHLLAKHSQYEVLSQNYWYNMTANHEWRKGHVHTIEPKKCFYS